MKIRHLVRAAVPLGAAALALSTMTGAQAFTVYSIGGFACGPDQVVVISYYTNRSVAADVTYTVNGQPYGQHFASGTIHSVNTHFRGVDSWQVRTVTPAGGNASAGCTG